MSLLLSILVLTLLTTLLSTLGSAALTSFLWTTLTSLPLPLSQTLTHLRTQRRAVAALRTELRGTSSQDEFAKWAKLRRRLDQAEATLEKLNKSAASTKAQFATLITALRFALTTGLRIFVQFWYSKNPVFWLPAGVVPRYVEWALAFPRAPMGSVSVQVWAFAVGQVVGIAVEVVVAVWAMRGENVEVPVEGVEREGEKEGVEAK